MTKKLLITLPTVGNGHYAQWERKITSVFDNNVKLIPISTKMINGDLIVCSGSNKSTVTADTLPVLAVYRFWNGRWEEMLKVNVDKVSDVAAQISEIFWVNKERTRLFNVHSIDIIRRDGQWIAWEYYYNDALHVFKVLRKAVNSALNEVEPEGEVTDGSVTKGVYVQTRSDEFIRAAGDRGMQMKDLFGYDDSQGVMHQYFIAIETEEDQELFDDLRRRHGI